MGWMYQNFLGGGKYWIKITRATWKNSGGKGKVHVLIPRIVDDYNHWICGVDMYDQNIMYYHPNLWWHTKWIPMLIQLLSVKILNSYMWYVSNYPRTKHYKPVTTHKYFWWASSDIFWIKLKIMIPRDNLKYYKKRKKNK